MKNKACEMLGLAKRAQKTICGELIFDAFRKRHVKLLVISESAGANILNKYEKKCAYYNIPFIKMDELMMNHSIGQGNKKAVAVLDEGFAKAILEYLKG